MEERIPVRDAKEELVKINRILTTPHILIGGLAVNQYDIARISTDIDLVIEFEEANRIIKELYPTLSWNRIDNNDDEVRPSYEIINRANSDLIIRFGPKILQRTPYEFLDWNILMKGAKKFSYQKSELDNILIPSSVNLSFTKLISYVSRKESNPIKAIVDLNDFVNLTNHESWNTIDFYTIITLTSSFNYLKENLKFSIKEKYILENCSLYQIINLFREPTNEIVKIPNPTDLQKKRVESAIEIGEKFVDTKERTKIAAIGLDLQGFTAINMKYGPEIGDMIISTIGELIGQIDLAEFNYQVIGDTFIVYIAIDDRDNLAKYASQFHEVINSHNWKEIQENLYVNSYTTYGFIKDSESVREFSKRIFDSILNQKENGHIFEQAAETISRNDWDIELMVSHR